MESISLIQDELKSGELVSIGGKYIKGLKREIVIARLSEKIHGVMANRLWNAFQLRG
jgi:hypothetical protein